MKTATLIILTLALAIAATTALKIAAPDLDYWHRVLILLTAYFSGIAARSVGP